MSTISITPGSAVPSLRPATRLRLTTRGRRVLAALAALPLAAALALVALNGAAAVASTDASEAASFETVTVLPGDTLWSLAGEVAPQADRREAVDAIIRLNRLDGGTIFAGQSLSIPLEYSPGR